MSTSISTPIVTLSTSISPPISSLSTFFSDPILTVSGTSTRSNESRTFTSTSTTPTASITSSSSVVYPGLSPTSYTTGGSAVPSPSASCLPRFEALNLTIVGAIDTMSATNRDPDFSEAFVKCCSPQPVFLYADSCLLYCPFYAKAGERQSRAGTRFSDCLRGFGQSNNALYYSTSASEDGQPNGEVQTATGDGSRVTTTGSQSTQSPTGLAAPTKFAAGVLAGLPLLAGLVGAVLV